MSPLDLLAQTDESARTAPRVGTPFYNATATGYQLTTDNRQRAIALSVPVTRCRAEDRPVLELADDALQSPVALQGHVLRVLIADGAELAVQVRIRNARAA